VSRSQRETCEEHFSSSESLICVGLLVTVESLNVQDFNT